MLGVAIAAVDLFGNLHYLLLLKSLTNLNQFACLTIDTGTVDSSHIVQTHDHVPAHSLGKQFESLWLRCARGKLCRIFTVGHTQQHTIVVYLYAEDLEIAGRRNQSAIVIVDGVAKSIVVGIELSAGLKQTHLVDEPTVAEDLDGLFSQSLCAAERHILVDDLLHASSDLIDIALFDRRTIGLVEVAEITTRDWVLDVQAAVGEDILTRLVEDKAQRTHIDTHPAWVAHVEELHVAVLIDAEFEPL